MTGADAVRYSFIVMDLHHLLLAGLPGALRVTPESGHGPVRLARRKRADIGCANHQFIAVATSFFQTNEVSGRHESARRDQVAMPDETKFKGRLFRH
jgi:hypothetical protein